jgi:hypothetical protein
MKNKPPAMKHTKILITGLVILLCVLSSGCTSSSGTTAPATPALTPVLTQAPATVPVTIATAVPTATTELIRVMPTDQQVTVLLTKDRTTTEIHLQYQGGAGERFVNKIMMRVYSPDGTYQEFLMNDGKKPLPGDEIVVPGTKGKDRCEVFVTAAGIRYKVLDDYAVGGGYY